MSSVEFFYDSDSDIDENIQSSAVRRRILRDQSNPLDMPDFLFTKNFRVNKDAFRYLLAKVELKLNPTIKSSSVLPILKLAAALRFFAETGYQTGTGNEYLAAVAQPTFSKNLQQILDVLEDDLCPETIKFPTSEEEKNKIKLAFFEKHGFPGVIGCVDGTHIRIVTPPTNEKHLYYNRKGFFSLNVMLVCDDQLYIRYVDANHPGSCHDSYIFNSSELDTHLQQEFTNGDRNSWLLGDAGYALKPYLIVPFRASRNERDPRESMFNDKHTSARNIIERTIGVLKNRFRCILGERQLHYSPDKARQIVNVCCALHNLCISYKLNMDIPINMPVGEEHLAPVHNDDQSNFGERIRGQIMDSIC